VSPMEYVTVTAGQPALAPVDPQRPPYGQPGLDGGQQGGSVADGSHPVIQARLRTEVEKVAEQSVRLHRRVVGLLPVPAVLLAGAIALALTHPGLAARLLLDAAALSQPARWWPG